MIARKGFTLIELLLVVMILAVLAAVVMPRLGSYKGTANQETCDTTVANLIRALELYAINNDGDYPAANSDFQSDVLGSATYFPHGTPTCPEGTAYVFVPATDTITAHSH